MNKSTADAYQLAGVDIDAGEAVVQRIAPLAAATHEHLEKQGARLLTGIGGFAAAVALPTHLRSPVLVSATDGVGTKVELARQYHRPEVVGRDVVAMCVNDLLCAGAQPLYFLDYFASGKLDPTFVEAVVGGISAACHDVGCALIGGETAEMPDTYTNGQFDVAGFAVGIAEQEDLLRPQQVVPGDALIAIAASGAHSNGYSLIRRLLRDNPNLAEQPLAGRPLIEQLLLPTRLYGRSIALLRQRVDLHGLAHITGGGITDNLPRILPPTVTADIDFEAQPLPPLFAVLQDAGRIPDEQMRRIFNCGIGMVAVVADHQADDAVSTLVEVGEQAWRLGRLVSNG